MKKTSRTEHPLSKRALTLGDGTVVRPEGVERGVPGEAEKRPGKPRIDKKLPGIIKDLQIYTTHLNSIFNPDYTPLRIDGVLGPKTASGLKELMQRSKHIRDAIQRYAGVSMEELDRYKAISRDSEKLSSILGILKKAANILKSSPAEKRKEHIREFDETRRDPPIEDIIEWLRTRTIKDPKVGERMNALDWLRMHGYSTRDKIKIVTTSAFGSPSGVPALENWSIPNLVNYVMMKSRQQFKFR